MAYVYSNALNVSIALLVLGLIQISLAVSCVFGCYAGYQYTYASPGWSGLLAFLTGVFGICMVRNYKEVVLGKCFFVLSLFVLLTTTACLALVAYFAWLAEYQIAYDKRQMAALKGHSEKPNATGLTIHSAVFWWVCLFISSWLNWHSEKLNATGLAIHSAVLLVGLCLFISSCYASWLNCCCEKAPAKKGYGLALEPVRISQDNYYTTV